VVPVFYKSWQESKSNPLNIYKSVMAAAGIPHFGEKSGKYNSDFELKLHSNK